MQFRIETSYNKAFSWIKVKGISFIGYFNNCPFLIPTSKEIEDVFAGCHSFSDYSLKINSLNGVFSIIINADDFFIAASDSTRFFPLFYGIKKDTFFLSDDIEYVRKNIASDMLDETACTEFLSAAFTGSSRTLYQKVFQIRPVEILSVKQEQINRQYFFSFSKTHSEIFNSEYTELLLQAKNLIDKNFSNLLKRLKGQKIALPLSGGYDSRLIAFKLKEHGFDHTVCFTYGRKNKEVEISKKVAETLGFKWYFVEYTDNLIKDFHQTKVFNDYYQYASRGTSMFFLQEYPAIKYLIENNIINKEYNALPGHSGDLLRGALLYKNFPENCTRNQLPDILLSNKFVHATLNRKDKRILYQKLNEHIDELYFNPELLPYSILEDWEMKERTAKYIFNSSHAFTYFGIKVFFPLWNKDIIEFFRRLPFAERLNGKLYYDVLKKCYFASAGLDFNNDIQPLFKDLIINNLKSRFRKYLPLSVKENLLVKNDWAYYKPMTVFLLNDLLENDLIVKSNGTSYLYRILNWYLMRITDSLKFV